MEKTKINEKEAGIGPFKKPCWQGPKKDERLRFETDLLVERIENRFRDDEAVRPYILRSLLPLPPPLHHCKSDLPLLQDNREGFWERERERERERAKRREKKKGQKWRRSIAVTFTQLICIQALRHHIFPTLKEELTHTYLPTYLPRGHKFELKFQLGLDFNYRNDLT